MANPYKKPWTETVSNRRAGCIERVHVRFGKGWSGTYLQRQRTGRLLHHTFKLRYLDKSGKKMQGHYYTPDFLVLRIDSVRFEEWKPESELKRLSALYPFRYQQQEDGSWRSPPAEEAAAELSLAFRVRSSAELHPTYIDNLIFLEDYFGVALSVPVPVQTTILERIRETPGLPLSALAYDGSGIRSNDVYAMLALDLLYTD